MNRKYFAYAIIAILIALSIGVLAISLGVHFSSAPVVAQEVPTEPPPSPPSTPDSLAPPSPPPPVSTRTICAGWLDLWCDRSLDSETGEIDGDDRYLHYIPCAAGHKHWSCNLFARRRHANCRAPAPRQTTTQTVRQTSSSQAQSPSSPSPPSQNPPASPPQSSCKKPTLMLKKLVIGRSAIDFPTLKVPYTFITDTKTSCKVKAEITYNGSQPPNTCEITSGSWSVTMTHGFRVSGTPTVTPSGSGFSKVWKYEATFTDSRSDAMSSSAKYAARGKERIGLNLTFTGTYSGGTVTKSAQVTQDQIDGMRQEYIDYNLHRTLKVLPSRGWFKSTLNVTAPDGSSTFTVSSRDSLYNSYKKTFSGSSKKPQEAFYNWGYYDYVLESKTDANYAIWMQHVDKVQPGLRSQVITCRYRPPHHNRRVDGAEYSTHQYGYALDVRGSHKADGSTMSSTERVRMRDAAYDKTKRRETADARLAYISGIPHVHADWAPTWWDDHRKSSSAQLRDMTEARDARRPSSTSSPAPDNNDDDDSGDSGGGGDSAPAAPAAPAAPSVSPPTKPTKPTTVRCGNRWRGPGRCSSGGRASSRTAHESTCGAGHTYWGCNRTAVEWHATSYTCTRSGCGLTYTKCSKGNGSCRARRPGGGTYKWHH